MEEDVDRKVAGFTKLKEAFDSMKPPPAHLAYFYAAMRRVERVALSQEQQAKHGVLVLGDACEGDAESLATLRRALTESLIDHALVLLDLSSAAAYSMASAADAGIRCN